MSQPADPPTPGLRVTAVRLALGVAVAVAASAGVYLLLEATRPDGGLVSFAFLLMLPGAVSGLVAWFADPWGRRDLGFYVLIPFWILAPVLVAAVVFLREGAVCVLMLAPLWLLGGCAGAMITYYVRRRVRGGKTYCAALLVAPLVCIQIEPLIPLQASTATVTRAIVVDASPDRIWPLVEGVPDVRRGEGRWNLTQDVVGVPRPVGARLVGEGVGAQRHAAWTRGITFRETVSEWSPGRRIGWRFDFGDGAGWDLTDRHLRPDSAYLRIVSGGYTLTPLADGRTRVALETRYWMRTPVNGYARLWGEVFLGDIEGNILALIKQRAERRRS